MNRSDHFSPAIYLFAFLTFMITPSLASANVPVLTVQHEEYLPPGQNSMNLTLSMEQAPGRILNASEINQYPVHKGIFYTSAPYQGLASTAGMPNSGWLPLLLNSASTTINWTALGAEQGKRISFFAVLYSYDGKLLAMSDVQHVTTGIRISANPANRIATIWTASKEAVTEHTVSAILPLGLGQNRGKEIVIKGPDGKLIPVQEFSWAKYANNADDDRQLRLTFPVNFKQPGGQAYEVYLENASQVDDPVCTVTPAVRNFLSTGAIKIKATGPRANEFYEANLNDLNFIGRTPTGTFFIEVKESGPIQHVVRFSAPLKPVGTGQHLPDVAIADMYLTYSCGEDSVSIHGTMNNSSIRVEPNRTVTASYDDLVLRNIEMQITPSVTLSAHTYTLPNNGGPFDGTNTYRLGEKRTVGNMTVQKLFPEAPAHELRAGLRHALPEFIITPTTNTAAIRRGQQKARLHNNAIVVNTDNANDNSWFKHEIFPGAGMPRMTSVSAAERADLMRQSINRINPYILDNNGRWQRNYYGLWAMTNPSTSPYNFYGEPYGQNAGGNDVQYTFNGAVPIFNAKDTGTVIVDSFETLKLIVDGVIRRDNMGVHYDAATGRPITYRELLTRMGTEANNPLSVSRQFNIVFGRVFGNRVWGPCDRDFPLYQCTRDTALLNIYDSNIAYLSEVPYHYEMDIDPTTRWSSHDNQHAIRQINKLGAGLTLADHKYRDYVVEMAKGVILLAAINEEDNGAHLRSYLRNAFLTPYEPVAGNRTLEPLMLLGLGLFLEGRSAVDDVVTNEIYDIMARTVQLGQMQDVGLFGERFANSDQYPAVEARLSQYFHAPVRIADAIQHYQSSLYSAVVLSLTRALDQSDNPAIQRSLQLMKQGLENMGTKGYNYSLGTLKIDNAGSRAMPYYSAHKVEFVGSNPRTFAIIPTTLSMLDPNYALGEPTAGGFDNYAHFTQAYGVWNERVRAHNRSEFTHNGVRYRTMPLITDEKKAADQFISQMLWAQQRGDLSGGGGSQPTSSGNGGNLKGGVLKVKTIPVKTTAVNKEMDE